MKAEYLHSLLPGQPLPAPTPFRAEIIALGEDGLITVAIRDGAQLACEWLDNGTGLRLAVGDRVLVAGPERPGEPGVVLGRIGPYRPPAVPDNLVVEAADNLTLRCGDSVIVLRRDGKLVLKGQDVLSRAKGRHRIKGGSVAIN